MGPTTIALAFGIMLLALLPARRLALGGLTPGAIGTYVLAVWLLAMVVSLVSGPARFLVPFLLVLYLAPFVTFRVGMATVRRRLLGTGSSRPARDVSPRPPGSIDPSDPPDDPGRAG